MEGDETFDSSLLGHADEVVEERVADDDVIMIKGTKTNSAVRNYLLNYYLYDWDISLSKYIYQKKKKVSILVDLTFLICFYYFNTFLRFH